MLLSTKYNDHVVLDVEIAKSINGPEGLTWDDTDKVGVSVAVLYEFNSDRFRIYGPQDLGALQARLQMADCVSGFNTWSFDFPVVWGKTRQEIPEFMKKTSNDILRRIWISLDLDPDNYNFKTHGGWSLDNIVKGTLGSTGKIAKGTDAPLWYQQGDLWKVINYCLDDVALERDLAFWVEKEGYVINAKTGRRVELNDSSFGV
jgi:DEAD/DEAH box helicase domain-containing protein